MGSQKIFPHPSFVEIEKPPLACMSSTTYSLRSGRKVISGSGARLVLPSTIGLYVKNWVKLGVNFPPANNLVGVVPFSVLGADGKEMEFQLLALASDRSSIYLHTRALTHRLSRRLSLPSHRRATR
jgi:hypothetical protein